MGRKMEKQVLENSNMLNKGEIWQVNFQSMKALVAMIFIFKEVTHLDYTPADDLPTPHSFIHMNNREQRRLTKESKFKSQRACRTKVFSTSDLTYKSGNR